MSLFIFCIFYFNEKELNQQVCLCLAKYAENEISDSTFHREREREREREGGREGGRERERHRERDQMVGVC